MISVTKRELPSVIALLETTVAQLLWLPFEGSLTASKAPWEYWYSLNDPEMLAQMEYGWLCSCKEPAAIEDSGRFRRGSIVSQTALAAIELLPSPPF